MPNLMLDKEISYMRKRLEKIYPSGVVVSLFEHDPDLYQYIKDYAYKNKSTVPRVLKSMGFKRSYHKNDTNSVVSKKTCRQSKFSIEQATQSLKELYPDGIVTSLNYKNTSLYNYIFRCAHERGISIEKFLQTLGFQKQHAQTPAMPDDQLKHSLLELYPDKEIMNLPSMSPNLYYHVLKASKTQNKKVKEYLQDLGFKYTRKVPNTGENKNTYDLKAMKKLYAEFNVSQRSLANILNVTKQCVSQRLLHVNDSNETNWEMASLTNEHMKLIQKLIENETTRYTIQQHSIWAFGNGSSVALVFKGPQGIECMFDIPTDINQWLKDKNFHKFSESDFQIRKKILKLGIFNGNQVKISNEKLRYILRNKCKKSHISMKSYFQHLGFEYLSAYSKNDEEILALIKQHVQPNTNKVFPPCGTAEYNMLTRIAWKTEHKTLRRLVEHYGFEYIDKRASQS